LAGEIAAAGAGVWLLAKFVKSVIVRGRPDTLLADVHIHGAAATGRGYLSGHAAVVFALVTLISPYLGRRARRAIWLIAIAVCFARIYTGAHLPLDVVAGAALGWGAASAVHLLLGAPQPPARGSRVSWRSDTTATGPACWSVSGWTLRRSPPVRSRVPSSPMRGGRLPRWRRHGSPTGTSNRRTSSSTRSPTSGWST